MSQSTDSGQYITCRRESGPNFLLNTVGVEMAIK